MRCLGRVILDLRGAGTAEVTQRLTDLHGAPRGDHA